MRTRQPRRHRALRPRGHPDGRDPDSGHPRRFEPAIPDLESQFYAAKTRRNGHRAVQGMVSGLRSVGRDDAACRKPLWREQSPYRRIVLQRSCPSIAPSRRDRSEASRRHTFDQRRARRQPAMIVAIVDYGSGNLRSAAKAFERAARENEIRAEVNVTSAPDAIAAADSIVLPGVGAFADCRRGLMAVPGLEAALHEAVMIRARPFLGICVGMQLLADAGREFETVQGLGGLGAGVHAYFVHSYHFRLGDAADLVASTDYGGPLAAVIGRNNLAGTQFHPEKSQETGLRLIRNFLRWRP